MKQKQTAIISLIALFIFGGVATYVFFSNSKEQGFSSINFGDINSGLNSGNSNQGEEYSVGAITSSEPVISPPTDMSGFYENPTYGFSFSYPEEYRVTTVGVSSGATFLVQNDKGNGFQIVISPFDEPISALTEERVRTDIPDLTIDEVQSVLLGSAGQGIAFVSDNDAFGGASREVWFVFRGNLYQISTYLKNDLLLQSILGTWALK